MRLGQTDSCRCIAAIDPHIEVLLPISLLLDGAFGHGDLVVIVQFFEVPALSSEHISHL